MRLLERRGIVLLVAGLALSGLSAAPAASGESPKMGKYRCFAWGRASAPPIFLGLVELEAGGAYTASKGKAGRYSYDAATSSITWESGWMKDNNFTGKVESSVKFRIAPTSICSHQ